MNEKFISHNQIMSINAVIRNYLLYHYACLPFPETALNLFTLKTHLISSMHCQHASILLYCFHNVFLSSTGNSAVLR